MPGTEQAQSKRWLSPAPGLQGAADTEGLGELPLPRHPLQRSLSQSSLNLAAGPVRTAADIIRLAGASALQAGPTQGAGHDPCSCSTSRSRPGTAVCSCAELYAAARSLVLGQQPHKRAACWLACSGRV